MSVCACALLMCVCVVCSGSGVGAIADFRESVDGDVETFPSLFWLIAIYSIYKLSIVEGEVVYKYILAGSQSCLVGFGLLPAVVVVVVDVCSLEDLEVS